MQSRWLVAIDLSTNPGSLSLFAQSGDTGALTLDEEVFLSGALKHSEELFDALGSLLFTRSLAAEDIVEWWVNRGPGSFTGLRIAMAAVKGICTATGAPLVLADGAEARALSLLATLEPQQTPPSEILVCTQSTATKQVVQRYAVQEVQVREIETFFTEAVPGSQSGAIVVTDGSWPSRSSYLPFTRSYERLQDGASVASAAPRYFASREFAKVMSPSA